VCVPNVFLDVFHDVFYLTCVFSVFSRFRVPIRVRGSSKQEAYFPPDRNTPQMIMVQTYQGLKRNKVPPTLWD
jgi:hypothetical protein